MAKYLKFVMSGAFSSTYKYRSLNEIRFYNQSNSLITITNGSSRIVSHTYTTRITNTDFDALFTYNGSGYTPYNSTLADRAEMVVNISDLPSISKIEIKAYANDGGANKVDIYQSADNVTFTLVGSINFAANSEIKSILYETMKKVVITIENTSIQVTKNSDAVVSFSITPPLFFADSTLSYQMTSQDLGTGKMFSAPIDLSIWESIRKMEVV